MKPVGDFAVCAGDPGKGSSSSSHKNLNILTQGNPFVFTIPLLVIISSSMLCVVKKKKKEKRKKKLLFFLCLSFNFFAFTTSGNCVFNFDWLMESIGDDKKKLE